MNLTQYFIIRSYFGQTWQLKCLIATLGAGNNMISVCF